MIFLTTCFCCGNNNIDLMMIPGRDFLPAQDILKNWLAEYQRDLVRSKPSPQSAAN